MPRRGRGRGGPSEFEQAQKILEQKGKQAQPSVVPVVPVSLYGREFYEMLQSYQRMEKMIWDLESQSPESRGAVLQERAKELSSAIAAKKQRGTEMEKELKKTKKREEALVRLRPGLTKFKARVGKDGLEKEKEKASEMIENIIQSSKENDEEIQILKDQFAVVKNDLKNLTSLSDELNALKIAQEDILMRIFSGPTGDPEENALERQVETTGKKKDQIARAKTSHDSASMHLQSALKQLQQGMGCLRKAGLFNTMDIMGNRPGPGRGRGMGPRGNQPFMNIAQAQEIRRCNQLLAEGKMNILQAKQYVPSIPHIDDADIQNMNVMLNLLFDNLLTDLVQRRKIMQNVQQLERTLDSVKYAARWIKEVIQRIDSDFAREEKDLFSLRRKLMEKRRDLIHGLILAEEQKQQLPPQQQPPYDPTYATVEPSAPPQQQPPPQQPPPQQQPELYQPPYDPTKATVEPSAPPAKLLYPESVSPYEPTPVSYILEEEEEEDHQPPPVFSEVYPQQSYSVNRGWSAVQFSSKKSGGGEEEREGGGEEGGEGKEKKEGEEGEKKEGEEKKEKKGGELKRMPTDAELYGADFDAIL